VVSLVRSPRWDPQKTLKNESLFKVFLVQDLKIATFFSTSRVIILLPSWIMWVYSVTKTLLARILTSLARELIRFQSSILLVLYKVTFWFSLFNWGETQFCIPFLGLLCLSLYRNHHDIGQIRKLGHIATLLRIRTLIILSCFNNFSNFSFHPCLWIFKLSSLKHVVIFLAFGYNWITLFWKFSVAQQFICCEITSISSLVY